MKDQDQSEINIKLFDPDIYIKYNPDIAKYFLTPANASIGKDALDKKLLNHYTKYGHQENRMHNKEQLKKVWITEDEIDNSFDYEFYLAEYPETIEFSSYLSQVSLRERLFNHYYQFGKIEGRYINKQQKYAYKIKTLNISKTIPQTSLKHLTNKLECISLLITDSEIQNGQYLQFIDRLVNSTTKKQIENIHFKIITNNINCCIETTALKTLFSNVDIISLNLNEEEDLYLKDTRKLEKTPKYGRKSGPNIMFYRAIEACKNYNTTLFLETDCFFRESWLQKLKDFIDCSNGFWISGALYDGLVPNSAGSALSTHINGGVGLYATGDETFRLFMNQSEIFLIEQIKGGLAVLAYDVGIKMYIDHITNANIKNSEDILIAKFINRQYVPNKIIGNFSTTRDTAITLEQIHNMYNYYIIHKK
jgi:hypothetical protein